MAVRIELDDVRDAVVEGVFRDAEALVDAGCIGAIVPVGGGAAATVWDRQDSAYEVWAGVVAGAFTAECECADAEADAGGAAGTEPEADAGGAAGAHGDPDELCVHAVALTIGALRDDFVWSPAAVPPSRTDLDD